MALPNYPNTPTLWQTFTLPNGTVMMWDGEKWKAMSAADSSLRGQLNDTQSVVSVGGVQAGTITVPLSHMKLLPTTGQVAGRRYAVTSFYDGWAALNTPPVGGGTFVWNPEISKSNHKGGKVVAPEAIAAWTGNNSDISTLLNWTGTGDGCYVSVTKDIHVAEFGATCTGSGVDVESIEAAFNFASTLKNGVVHLGAYHSINRAINFRKFVTVRGNGSWIMNYGLDSACVPHPDDGIVLAKVEDFNITYQNYGTPLNPTSPPYTIDKTKKLGRQIVWSHLSLFSGDGMKHSTTGRFFQDFDKINVYWHRYGFHMMGWTSQGRNCRAMYNKRGFFGSNASISSTRYPVHALQLNECHAIANTEHGFDIRYADGVNLKGCHSEKNYERNIRAEGVRGFSADQFYQEYSDGSILLFNSQGVNIHGYSGGNRQVYKGYAKAAAYYYEETIVSGTSVTVTAHDPVSKIGINNFTSVPTSEIAVIMNDTYVQPGNWSRSGAVITVPAAIAGSVISVIAYAYLDPSVDISAIQDKYELGTSFPIESQHSQNVQFGGFATSYKVGPIQVNDFDLANLEATSNVYYDAYLKDTPVYTVPNVYTPWGTGFELEQRFKRGLRINSITDANVDVGIKGTQHYPQIGQVATITLTDAKNSVWMIISGAGCAMFTFDGNGNLHPAMVSNPLDMATVNPASAGKLNLYSSGANMLSYDNRLGYATQFTLLRFADN